MKRSLAALAVAVFCALPTARAQTTIDLTTAGATSTQTAAAGGSFTVTQISPQSTGTGVIDSFLRTQANGNEQGYNTSLGAPMDDKAGSFTRALLLSEVPVVNIGGVNYRQFLLDINQSSGSTNNLLNLNQIQIFQSTTDRIDGSADINANPPVVSFGAGATQVFQMSSAGTNWTILMDFQLNSGSGSGDMFLYVRDSDFSAAFGEFVILYNQFGQPPGTNGSNDGFEEWAVLKPEGTPPVSIPAPPGIILGLVGLGCFGVANLRKLRRKTPLAAA